MSLYVYLRTGVPYQTLLKRSEGVKIEEWSFRLHSRTTSFLIIALSTLTCGFDYLGQNIRCLPVRNIGTTEDFICAKFIETYCYILTTFTVPYNAEGIHHDTVDASHDRPPGGWPYIEGETSRVYHAYYQWVPFFLLFLGFLFYLPHKIWKTVEDSRIKFMVQQLNATDLKILSENQTEQIKLLVSYLCKSKGSHTFWSTIYIFCEILNLGIVAFSMYITDSFLNGEFAQYGLRAIKFLEDDPETRVDPMAYVFPRITKCQFRRYGPSGTIENFDTLCILSANILNEKIFVFLWVWFLILSITTMVMLLYRVLTILSSQVRLNGLGVPTFNRNSQMITVLERFGVCDWILLRLLRINLDEHTFMKLVTGLYDEIIRMRMMG